MANFNKDFERFYNTPFEQRQHLMLCNKCDSCVADVVRVNHPECLKGKHFSCRICFFEIEADDRLFHCFDCNNSSVDYVSGVVKAIVVEQGEMEVNTVDRQLLHELVNPVAVSPASPTLSSSSTSSSSSNSSSSSTSRSVSPAAVLPSKRRKGKNGTGLKCEICDIIFANRTRKSAHMLNYHSDATNECSLCSKSFTRKDNLKRHMKSKHENEESNN